MKMQNVRLGGKEIVETIGPLSPMDVGWELPAIVGWREKEGHEVIRIPPYHCDLNAIEFVWSSVKRIIKERNVTDDLSLDNLKSLLQTAITEVTSAEWAAHCKHVEKLENNYWKKDGQLEDLVDELSFQIDTNDDSGSEETETCESDLEGFEMLE
ncbi:hypothetical protein HNY73_013381 [Argiope bruennichi]|uniref:Tc1-like transposase DDE domain-containing protein n=1 Tax=Argiope bruennichi TaxID=94029 RepID=A0A8T0EZT6_ARGBR|nr:hypothetical protein HNY73_013381 [Argiope bruennichi]